MMLSRKAEKPFSPLSARREKITSITGNKIANVELFLETAMVRCLLPVFKYRETQSKTARHRGNLSSCKYFIQPGCLIVLTDNNQRILGFFWE